jgi:hypothetical protein
MLPEFYHKCLSSLLTARQYASLRIIVIILQSYRTIQIEKLAALLPIPIKYESRRRHLQRFLVIPQLTPECIWFPLLKKWLKVNHNFWVGLYGGLWVETFQICHHWVEQLMILTPNKLPFFQKGLRAKELILSTL